MAEIVAIFVGMPGMALFSWIVIASLKHLPAISRAYGQSPRLVSVAIVVLLMIGGYLSFRARIRPYRAESSAYLDFDSELDRSIIFWQKVGVVILCGVVLPWIAILLFLIV